jgi:hypothetical protein
LTTVAFNALLSGGRCCGVSVAVGATVAVLGLGSFVGLVGFAVDPDIVGDVSAWVLVGVALWPQFVLVLHGQTRAHVRPRTERGTVPS